MSTTTRAHPLGPGSGPDPGPTRRHRSSPTWVRSMRYWMYQYKRTWRGSITTSFLYPVLYLAAMGLGLGSLIKGHVDGVRYLDFLAPGLLASTAMQIGGNEAMYPVMAAIKWLRTYFAMLATPLTVIDVLVGHLAWIALRLVMVTSIYLVIMAAFGTVHSPLAILALPVGVLTGLAFAAPIAAFAAAQQNDTGFSTIYRFGLIPLFLFSGTFFPITQLPGWLQPVAEATPLYHGVALCRSLVLGHLRWAGGRRPSRLPGGPDARGVRAGHPDLPAQARDVSEVSDRIGTSEPGGFALRITPMAMLGTRRAGRLVERNVLVYRRSWVFFVSGFFEPFFYLLSIGVGLSKLVGPIHVGHELIPYTTYVAPGLLASSAMNGATLDSTFNVFFKLKIAKTYDAVLSTPLGPGDVALGELTWSLIRATIYSTAFLVVMAGLGYVAVAVGGPVSPRGDVRELRLRRRGDGGNHLHAQLAGLRQGLSRPHPALLVLGHLLSRCRCTRAGSRP